MQDIIFSKSDSYFNLHLTCIIILNSFCYLLIDQCMITLCFVKLAFAFSDYFFSQTNRKVQNNVSPRHVAEQKVLTISHRNNKNSSHFLQPQHGNTLVGRGARWSKNWQNHSKKREKKRKSYLIKTCQSSITDTVMPPPPHHAPAISNKQVVSC